MDSRRRAVVVVFCVLIAVDLFAVASSLLELDLLDRVKAGEPVTNAELTGNDDRQTSVGAVQFAMLITGAVVFIRWLRAAYRNVDVVAPGLRRYGHGWAIGAWFVPFLNLWRPEADRQRCLARRRVARRAGAASLVAQRLVGCLDARRRGRAGRATANGRAGHDRPAADR